MKNLIVQKFGGATLADPEKMKHAAVRVAKLAKAHPLIVVVSAMGKTTDSLIELAKKVSAHPHRREMDMLLSVGERMSMSLLSMALNDLGCAAISFTGSQAGIMTDDSHVNAFIQDVRPVRLVESLNQNKVVILAGFQGVSPRTKEITTLGRGGSDTTAVAMAAHFKALRCDILKEVPAVFSADPRRIPTARPIKNLTYQQLADMTFWGAKVLHYRSAELALTHKVPLYIGPAADDAVNFRDGTQISEDPSMYFETPRFLALNSHQDVLVVQVAKGDWFQALEVLKNFLAERQLPQPQVLQTQQKSDGCEIWFTGPEELMRSARHELRSATGLSLTPEELCTITLSCTGSVSGEAFEKISASLKKISAPVRAVLCQGSQVTVLLPKQNQQVVLETLHHLIDIT